MDLQRALRLAPRWTAAILVSVLGAGSAPPTAGGGPVGPDRHGRDLVWFVQVSDSHLTVGRDDGADNLAWAVRAALDEMQADFVVHTGDLVDHSLGGPRANPRVRCYPQEWQRYRSLLPPAARWPRYVDLPGNHEQYGDRGLTCYRTWSVAGAATGDVQHVWSRPYASGVLLFVGLATAADTPSWQPAHGELSGRELTFLDNALTEHRDATLAFVFGHHPPAGLSGIAPAGSGRLLAILESHRVAVYGHGHTHTPSAAYRGALLVSGVGALESSRPGNLALFTVDGRRVRVRHHHVGRWPLVQVTAPLDASLGGGNPFAEAISSASPRLPVRAVAFAPGGQIAVRFRADGGPWVDMPRTAEHVFEAGWSLESVAAGRHLLEVEASSPHGLASDRVEVAIR